MMKNRIFILAGLSLFMTVFFAGPVAAQLETVLPQDGETLSSSVLQLFAMVTILSLAPGIAMMVTCLPFMVIVFSFLRQAIGLQQSPPNMMIMSLSLFLTFFVMEPVFVEAWQSGIKPFMDGNITEAQAFENAFAPFQGFMLNRVEPETLMRLGDALPDRRIVDPATPPTSLLVPSFMLSEIKHGFQIGFVIFLPFLIIDLVVASILMAMGMMMVPPSMIALPFKVGFFVMADGWMKITEALLKGYAG